MNLILIPKDRQLIPMKHRPNIPCNMHFAEMDRVSNHTGLLKAWSSFRPVALKGRKGRFDPPETLGRKRTSGSYLIVKISIKMTLFYPFYSPIFLSFYGPEHHKFRFINRRASSGRIESFYIITHILFFMMIAFFVLTFYF